MSYFIYHHVPLNLTGTALRPLNRLKDTEPDLYEQNVQKYKGREGLLQSRVIGLNCLWNDVLHFSPVHPKEVSEALYTSGFGHLTSEWFEIDPSEHNFNRHNTTIFLHRPKKFNGYQAPDDEFESFELEKIAQYSSLPAETKNYFLDCQREGKRPLIFCWVPHILFRGELNLSSLKKIRL